MTNKPCWNDWLRLKSFNYMLKGHGRRYIIFLMPINTINQFYSEQNYNKFKPLITKHMYCKERLQKFRILQGLREYCLPIPNSSCCFENFTRLFIENHIQKLYFLHMISPSKSYIRTAISFSFFLPFSLNMAQDILKDPGIGDLLVNSAFKKHALFKNTIVVELKSILESYAMCTG